MFFSLSNLQESIVYLKATKDKNILLTPTIIEVFSFTCDHKRKVTKIDFEMNYGWHRVTLSFFKLMYPVAVFALWNC